MNERGGPVGSPERVNGMENSTILRLEGVSLRVGELCLAEGIDRGIAEPESGPEERRTTFRQSRGT